MTKKSIKELTKELTKEAALVVVLSGSMLLGVSYLFLLNYQKIKELPTYKNDHTDMCYSNAMIGHASVINARLGVLPDAIITIVPPNSPNAHVYHIHMLGAYLWKGSPREYANAQYTSCVNTLAVKQ